MGQVLVMLAILRHWWRSIGVAMFIVGIFWLPKDLEDYEQAAEPWRKLANMVDQNTALWAFALALSAYIIWMDMRPFWRARFLDPKFPPRHAALLEELANYLSEAKQLVLSIPRRHTESHAHKLKYAEAKANAQSRMQQIEYDKATAHAARDFLKVCDKIYLTTERKEDTHELRRDLKAMSAPLFKALHGGKSVNRAAIPSPQWLTDTARRTRP